MGIQGYFRESKNARKTSVQLMYGRKTLAHMTFPSVDSEHWKKQEAKHVRVLLQSVQDLQSEVDDLRKKADANRCEVHATQKSIVEALSDIRKEVRSIRRTRDD